MTFNLIKLWSNRHKHDFDHWDEPKEIVARDSFRTTVEIVQCRTCVNCGYLQSRTISTTRSRD